MDMQRNLVLGVIGAFAGLVVLVNSVFVVGEYEQAMVLQFGRVVRQVATPGLHVKMPLVEQLMFFDKRILETQSTPEEVQTLDKKRVVVDSFTRWRIKDVGQFYRSVRTETVAVQRLNTIVNSNIRSVVASLPLMDMVKTRRSEVMNQILKISSAEADALGIQIVDVRLKRADLPPENSEAVFRRMRAERQKEAREIRAEGEEAAQKVRAEAERDRTNLLAEAERDAQKLRGEGDGTALRISGKSFSQDPGFFKLTRSLEAYKESMKPSNTLFVLDPGTDFLDTLVAP